MKNIFFILLVATSSTAGVSQDISVFTKENETITTIIAKNISNNISYLVTISLNATGYKITQAPPFEVSLKPGEQKEIVKLIEKPGEKLSLEYQVSYKKIAGTSEPNLSNLIILPKDTIYVFSGHECSKSESVIKKLKESNKVFKNYNLGESANYELLRDVLAAQLKPGQVFNFYTPILVVESNPIIEPKKVDDWIKALKVME